MSLFCQQKTCCLLQIERYTRRTLTLTSPSLNPLSKYSSATAYTHIIKIFSRLFFLHSFEDVNMYGLQANFIQFFLLGGLVHSSCLLHFTRSHLYPLDRNICKQRTQNRTKYSRCSSVESNKHFLLSRLCARAMKLLFCFFII